MTIRYAIAAALLAAAASAPLAQASASGALDVDIGGQLGVAQLSAEFAGAGSDAWRLDHNAGTAFGVVAALNGAIQSQAIRWTAQAEHAGWSNADTTTALIGVDAVWHQADDSGGVYIGPRLGALYFTDDLTDDSDTGLAYGIEAGFLQSLAPLDRGLDDVSLGFYLRQLFTDVRNDGQVPGSSVERDVDLDGQVTFGLQVLWSL